MSDIANAFESMVTPPGTNARRGQEDQIRKMAGDAGGLAEILLPLLRKQLEFQGATEGMRQDALNRYMSSTGGAARDSRIDRFGAAVDSNAATKNAQTRMQMKQAGLGDGGLMGTVLGNTQDAAKQKNNYYAQQFSPEAMAQEAQGMFGALGQYGQGTNDSMNLYNALYSMVNGQQPVQDGKGFGDIFGQVAATATKGM